MPVVVVPRWTESKLDAAQITRVAGAAVNRKVRSGFGPTFSAGMYETMIGSATAESAIKHAASGPVNSRLSHGTVHSITLATVPSTLGRTLSALGKMPFTAK